MFDLVDRSEFVRVPGGLPFAGDLGIELLALAPRKKLPPLIPGLAGDVAIGEKNGSTIGFFTAVCSAVKNRRGPAGLGRTITSGTGAMEPEYEFRIDCMQSLITL